MIWFLLKVSTKLPNYKNYKNHKILMKGCICLISISSRALWSRALLCLARLVRIFPATMEHNVAILVDQRLRYSWFTSL